MKKLIAALIATAFASGVAVAANHTKDEKKADAKPAAAAPAKEEKKADAKPAAKADAKAEAKKEEKKTEAKK